MITRNEWREFAKREIAICTECPLPKCENIENCQRYKKEHKKNKEILKKHLTT